MFNIKHLGNLSLKQKVVVVHMHEWKFKANIARNDTLEVHVGLN